MKLLNKLQITILSLVFCIAFFYSCQQKSKQVEKSKTEIVIPPPPPPPNWADSAQTLKENVLTNYITIAKTVIPNLKNGEPFDKLDYDKLIAYDFAGSEEPYPAVIEDGRFVPVVLAQQFFSQVQADKILKTLTSKSAYGESTAACFQPHFALVFYKENKMVNQINICLSCNYLISDISIPAQSHKKVNKGTKDEYAVVGFTSLGRKAIIDLCKELNFTYGKEDY